MLRRFTPVNFVRKASQPQLYSKVTLVLVEKSSSAHVVLSTKVMKPYWHMQKGKIIMSTKVHRGILFLNNSLHWFIASHFQSVFLKRKESKSQSFVSAATIIKHVLGVGQHSKGSSTHHSAPKQQRQPSHELAADRPHVIRHQSTADQQHASLFYARHGSRSVEWACIQRRRRESAQSGGYCGGEERFQHSNRAVSS